MKDKIIDGHTIGLISARDRLRMTIDFLQRIEDVTSDVKGEELGSAIKAVARDRKFHFEFIGTMDEIEAVTILHKGIQVFIDRMMKDFRDLTDHEKREMNIITEHTYFRRQVAKDTVGVVDNKPLLIEKEQEIEN